MLDIEQDCAEARKFASIITRMELRAKPDITALKELAWPGYTVHPL
jgi:hypothetical protein